MNIIFMGPQGSGKTTQAEILADKLKLPFIGTGDIYRQVAGLDTELGKRVKAILDKGDLVDDETTFKVVDSHLSEIKSGFILDGFPRTLAQAQRELFPVDKVIYIKLTDDTAVKRLAARGRSDDTPEVIGERLRLYHEETEPILDYYRKQGKLLEVDGSGTIEEVEKLIWEALGNE